MSDASAGIAADPPEGALKPARRGVSAAFLGAEAAGAFAAAVVALPQALSLGVLAFAALGPAYAGAGVAAALLASVVGNLAAASGYAVKCHIVGSRSATAALVAGLMAVLVAHPLLQLGSGGADVPRVLALVFAAIALSGLLQLVFGLAGLGRAVKYVPYPVVAGFMNGIALIIVLSQLRAVLGLDGFRTLGETLGQLGEIRWGAVATAVSALATVFLLPRLTRRVAPMVGGLLVGVVVHYAIALASPQAVGAVVGPLPGLEASVAEIEKVATALVTLHSLDASILQLVLAQATMLAIVGALDALLAAVIVDGVTRGRHNSNRVLVGQGLGNIMGGLLGALPSQLNGHTPVANFKAGGRTRLATVLHAAFILAVLAAVGPIVAGIPVAALAGIMLFIAFSLVDRWSSDLVRRIREGRQDSGEIAVNIGIVALVAAAQVAMNVMAALAVGVAISVALLLVKLSGSPVRRRLDGTARSSHKIRSPEAREGLRAMAGQIRILELKGELFFGTADNLQSEVEEIPEGVRFVVLDFRRVHEIDASGAHVLEVIGHRAQRRGLTVLLSDVRASERRGQYLRALGLEAAIPAQRWFADLDRALEWAEDQLLQQTRFVESEGEEIPLARMALLRDLTAEELERVAGVLERIELSNGDPVFREGDAGDHLYLLAQGAVSIKMQLDSGPGARRLATFGPGVMFGEMALVERKDRSADAFAKGERVVLYALSAARFEELVREDPALGSRIHRNLSRELAGRVRATTEALRALE